MSMTTRSRSTVLLLLLLNLLLLLVGLYEVMVVQGAEPLAVASLAPRTLQPPVSNRAPVAARAIEDYAAIINRPLFNKERRPLEKEDTTGSDEDALAFTLVGVILTSEQQVAIIYSRSQKQPVKVALWEWLEGWRLVSVEPQGVHLRKGNRSLELALQRTSHAGAK